jgi:nucleotide-binding universal stress UspA family protein
VLELRRNEYSFEIKCLSGIANGQTRISSVTAKSPQPATKATHVRKILAPTDFSSRSAGVRYALNAARELHAEVVIYHVITAREIAAFGRRRKQEALGTARFQGLIEAYELRLQQFIKRNFAADAASVRIKQKVEFGTPEKGIINMAKSEAADLIIMASSGKGRFARMFFGSVTEEVIRRAPCPVVAVPAGVAAVDEEHIYQSVA